MANEPIVARKAESLGWKVLRNGWPDLLLYDRATKKIIAIEVKSSKKEKPKTHQRRMHKILKEYFDLDTIIVINNGGKCTVPLPKP